MTDPYVVVVTGSRTWSNRESVAKRLKNLPPNTVLIHGDCRGLDTLAKEEAIKLGFEVRAYPANWDLYGKAAGPIRNQEMLNLKPALVIAFHQDLKTSKGTKDCVGEAMRRGITVELIDK